MYTFHDIIHHLPHFLFNLLYKSRKPNVQLEKENDAKSLNTKHKGREEKTVSQTLASELNAAASQLCQPTSQPSTINTHTHTHTHTLTNSPFTHTVFPFASIQQLNLKGVQFDTSIAAVSVKLTLLLYRVERTFCRAAAAAKCMMSHHQRRRGGSLTPIQCQGQQPPEKLKADRVAALNTDSDSKAAAQKAPSVLDC